MGGTTLLAQGRFSEAARPRACRPPCERPSGATGQDLRVQRVEALADRSTRASKW